MGSIDQPTPTNEDIIVVITGFAPFRTQYPTNPSWEIASSLPPLLSLPQKPGHPPRDIRLLVHPSPVKVSYETVRRLIPELWQGIPRIDLMIHIGMASGRRFYSVERRAHRQGYRMGDVDGVVLGDEAERCKERGEEWCWEACPKELESDIDVDDTFRRWKMTRPDDDVRISEDAGRYLCDFIYFSSLAYLWERKETKRVLFFHVPVAADEESIKKGTAITLGLIQSAVESTLSSAGEMTENRANKDI